LNAAPKKRAAGCSSFDAKPHQKFPNESEQAPLCKQERLSAPKPAFDAVSSHLFTALSGLFLVVTARKRAAAIGGHV